MVGIMFLLIERIEMVVREIFEKNKTKKKETLLYHDESFFNLRAQCQPMGFRHFGMTPRFKTCPSEQTHLRFVL